METNIICPHCGQTPRAQHSNKRAGICDGLKSGKLKLIESGPSFVIALDAKTGDSVTYRAEKIKNE